MLNIQCEVTCSSVYTGMSPVAISTRWSIVVVESR